MNTTNFEQEIIQKYIIKDKRDRIIWELNNSKKRNRVFWHFAGVNLLDKRYLVKTTVHSAKELEKKLLQLGGTHLAYYIGSFYVGELLLKQAVAYADKGDICVIYCGNGIGYYQGEQDNGVQPRYFLVASEKSKRS